MTLNRVGKELPDEEEKPKRVDGVKEAFQQFKPAIDFKTSAGPEATEFRVQMDFRSLKDFHPDNVLKPVPGKPNDLADLQNTIRLLYELKKCWSLPAIQRVWQEPANREQIIAALVNLREEIQKLPSAKGGR
jgi:predicted component of type VI protein secretion system